MENTPSPPGIRQDRHSPYLRCYALTSSSAIRIEACVFNVDQLGFGLVMEENYESAGRWLAVEPPDGHTVLALITPHANRRLHLRCATERPALRESLNQSP
jgi:hypothetical protein